jgi:pimeloyl-ACP methyl ester carboxylesterase
LTDADQSVNMRLLGFAGSDLYRHQIGILYFLRRNPPTKLSMPVLALGGERTMGATAGGPKLKEALEHLQVEVVPRSAHWVIHDAPDFVTQQLLSFFGRE